METRKKLPNVHNNETKRAVTTVIDVFHLHTGKWNSMETQGNPPLGVFVHQLETRFTILVEIVAMTIVITIV